MEQHIQSEQLRHILAQLIESEARVQSLERISETELSAPSPSGGWSAIKCVDHLNRTSQSFIPLLTEAIAKAKSLPNKSNSYHLDLPGWLLVKSLSSRKSFVKSKTAPSFVPPGDLEVGSTLLEFHTLQSQLIDLLRGSDGLAIGKVKVRSPFNSKISYSVYSAFRILAVHEDRHLDQAQAAMSH